jgi:hypothetical protein
VFVIALGLDKDLVVEVVEVAGDKDIDVAHDFEDVQTLWKHCHITRCDLSVVTVSKIGSRDGIHQFY